MSKRSLGVGSGSGSSCEEGNAIDYECFVRDVNDELPPKTGEYYYQDYDYVRPTQSDFDRKQVKDSKLFDKTKEVKSEDSTVEDAEPYRDASILISGFGMRNVDSFQRLIAMSREQRRKWELRKLWRDKKDEPEDHIGTARTDSTEASTSTETRSKRSSSDFLTQTETATVKSSGVREDIRHLDYLLGIDTEIEEAPSEELEEVQPEESEDDFKYSSSKSIREAQRYLRQHRIFECFQFIAAHLLSANAENPIEFILNLLNRCLLYRSGLGSPPLLYDTKHISKLFDLMDRLQSGFIDKDQYVTGMKTFGICTYNETPEMNDDEMITREVFIEEVYEAQLALFDDLIKRRPEKGKKGPKRTPTALTSVSIPSLNPPYFIPSDLFKFNKLATDTQSTMEEG